MMLKHLKPGDEFEYVTTKPAYRSGKFLVLGDDNSYLRPVAVDNCRFLFSYGIQKVVRHFGEQEIIKKGTAMKSQKEMGHFIGWKFGVPVKILNTRGVHINDFMYLIDETTLHFMAMSIAGNVEVYSKSNRSYELIPHIVCHAAFSPRYPVCQSPKRIAYCNSGIGKPQMAQIDSCDVISVKPFPVATLNIDGKTIELSAETTAELKKKLGV